MDKKIKRMEDPKNKNIFPEGMFPKRTHPQMSDPKNSNTNKSTQKKEGLDASPFPFLHIPYKVEACRLSRKVHLTEEAYDTLHITEQPKKPKSSSVQTIKATPEEKRQIPSALIPSYPVSPQKKRKGKSESMQIVPITVVKKRQKSDSSGRISIAPKEKNYESSPLRAIPIPHKTKQKEKRKVHITKQASSKNTTLSVELKKTSQEQVHAIISESRQKLLQLAKTLIQAEKGIANPIEKKQKTKPSFFRFGSQKKKAKKYAPKQKKSPGMLGEVVRFGATTAAIFMVSFAVMNASALSELFSAKLNPVAAVEKQIALEKAVGNKYVPILPTAGMKHENHKSFPQLDIKVGPLENRIIIPKIGKNVPVVDVPTDALQKGDWERLENDIQTALKDGVVHYPSTAHPGQIGNVFITGHSSYYLWDPGKYKDVFVRLHDMDVGDEFTIFWNQDVYHYRIRERKVVAPEETSVLKQPNHERIATLMTCTPIGTAKNRLVLVAEQI